MTQEEKAKAYDSIFERLKEMYNNNKTNIAARLIYEKYFPELKESEDDMIRNEIISYLKGFIPHTDIDLVKKSKVWIDYLEKQGGHNDISNVPSREVILAIWELGNEWKERTNGRISTECGTQLDYIQKHWNESNYYEKLQSEQKSVQETEPTPIFKVGNILKRKGKDYTFRVDRIQGGYYLCDHNHGAFFPIEEQGNWELVEQKSFWSEEDEEMFEEVCSSIKYAEKHRITCSEKLAKLQLDWLKSLKDRVQPKQEWNEDDAVAIDCAVEVLSKELPSLAASIKRLKLIRPQKQWKPSEKQMEELARVTRGNSYPYLSSLYNDLKKL